MAAGKAVIAGYDPVTGKHIIRNVLGKTQSKVRRKLAEAIASVEALDVSRSREYTVASWLHCWYDLYAQSNIRQTTAERYRLMMDTYTIPRIGDIKLVKLTSRDLQQLYKELMESGRVNRKIRKS